MESLIDAPATEQLNVTVFATISIHSGSVDLGAATAHREQTDYAFLTSNALDRDYRTPQNHPKRHNPGKTSQIAIK